MARITIIETGNVRTDLREEHGSYPEMFARLILSENKSVSFDVVSVVNGALLPDPKRVQAVLITGSSTGVYDKLNWIAPLEEFVRAVHRLQTPMVGVCFGHQLIAQALGGRVRKVERGWGVGRHIYEVLPRNGIIEGEQVAVACSHQDQVVEAPAGSRTILFSSFTPHAGLLYENGSTLSLQPHPEFEASYALASCLAKKNVIPERVISAAKASLMEPLDRALLGRAIARFLARPRYGA